MPVTLGRLDYPIKSDDLVLVCGHDQPIQTFADLEAHLEQLAGPVIVDEAALARLRKVKAARAD